MALRHLSVPLALCLAAGLASCGSSDKPAESAPSSASSSANATPSDTSAAPSGGASSTSATPPDGHGNDDAGDDTGGSHDPNSFEGEEGALEPNIASAALITERLTKAKVKDPARIASTIKKSGPYTTENYKTKITSALEKAGYSSAIISTVLKHVAM